ncbi:hypothetical protein F5Y16DRAFT_384738 [Xylariaceae sp. FL0255]|nr:hypothetical protein F5Y16DRAFT_384738 [Xylariaceae sp. FL0255]
MRGEQNQGRAVPAGHSETKVQNNPYPVKPTSTNTTAPSKLWIETAIKLHLSTLVENAQSHTERFLEELQLTFTDPEFLAYSVDKWHKTRPEIIPDEKGRVPPANSDRYSSAALLQCVENAMKTTMIWSYITHLLELLYDTTEKALQAIVLQELSNACYFEFARAQDWLKRSLCRGEDKKWFKRVTNSSDNGVPRIVHKNNIEQLEWEDRQMYYLLQQCHAKTKTAKIKDWFKRLDDLYEAHPGVVKRLHMSVISAVGDVNSISYFIWSLSRSLFALPAFNRKKAQDFIYGIESLEVKLHKTVKSALDQIGFLIPVNHLLQL